MCDMIICGGRGGRRQLGEGGGGPAFCDTLNDPDMQASRRGLQLAAIPMGNPYCSCKLV